MRVVLLLAAVMMLQAGTASAQIVRNPGGVAFACADHDRDDQHEIDIVRESDGVVVATLLGGDPPLSAQNEVVISVNVQPIEFGQYRFVIRAVAGSIRSENSAPSEVWERAPQRPGQPAAR